MKKTIILILLLSLFTLPVFSNIDFSLGANAQYQIAVEKINISSKEYPKAGQFHFGAEMRLKLYYAYLDAQILYSPATQISLFKHEFSFLPTLGVTFDIGSIVRLSVGFGPRLIIRTTENGEFLIFNADKTGPSYTDSFKEALGESSLTYKMAVDFLVSNFVIGITYITDSKFRFGYPEGKDLVPDFKAGKLGLYLGYKF